jgi:hypothetical protein
VLLSSADAEQNESGLSLSGSAGGEGGGELSFTETGYPLEWVYLELSKVDSLNRLKLVKGNDVLIKNLIFEFNTRVFLRHIDILKICMFRNWCAWS